MSRLWARIIRKHRIERQGTAQCTFSDVEEALTGLCHEFDIPRPLWLDKHCREQVERAKEYQYQIQDSLESQAARRGELAKSYQENVETYMAIQQQAEEMARAYLYEMD